MTTVCLFDLDDLRAITDVHGGQTVSGDTLRTQIARVRERLADGGVSRETFVVISHGGTPAFFIELLATWSLGACAVCTNETLTPGELERIVTFVEPVLVTTRGGLKRPAQIAGRPVVDLCAGAGDNGGGVCGRLTFPADSPALILFTSGTTGDPKGVVHTGASVAARIRLNREAIGDSSMSRTLCVLPTHFGHGLIGNCLTPLAAGGHLHLFPAPGVDGCARLAAVMREHRITFMSSVPSFWKVVTRLASTPSLPALQRVHVGSAPLSTAQWRQIRAWCGAHVAVWNLYGLTETANWTAGANPRDEQLEDGLVGTMWGGRAGVRGDDGTIRTTGRGEIVLDTPSRMAGYFKRADLTAAAIQDGWYRTGDFGEVDDNGVIRLLGRIKTEINRAGMKILPEEIDLLLERHVDVEEACTFGVADAINGEGVAAAIRLRQGSVVGEAAIRDWCLDHIRRECVPEQWFIVEEIPKTDRGKINREQVRRACIGA